MRKLFSPLNKIHQTDGGQAADKNVELGWKGKSQKGNLKSKYQKTNLSADRQDFK